MIEGHPLVSKNVSGMTVSAIKEMAMRAAKIDDVASLTWGLPSFRTPEAIRRAIQRLLDSDPDLGKYTLPDGLPALRQAAAETHRQATGVLPDPDRQVMVTAGNMQGLNALFHVLIDPGDEIILTDPGFASHVQQIRLCGGEPVFWALDEARDWQLDLDLLPGLISERTKAIVLVTPSNPTGTIFREPQLRRVGEIARERGLLVLLDDPYHHFCYENARHYFNLAAAPEFGDHVAYLFTFSKAHAMTGWRIGYMVLPEALKKQVLKVHDATLICAPRVSQLAAIAALTEEQTHVAEFGKILGRRRSLICERLDRMPHVFDYVKPEGTYYVFPRIVADHGNSFEFCVRMLEEAGVALTPGSAFGPTGEGHVRMAFCVTDDAINRAFDRLEQHFAT